MTPAEQRERDARIADEVARYWRKIQKLQSELAGRITYDYHEFGIQKRKAVDAELRAEVAEECARRIRGGEG